MYVADPVTQLPIPQGKASDGSGYGFDAPAIIWLAWSFAVGAPLMLAGIRLSRLTTGAAIGMACTLLIWAALVNTESASGIPDILLDALCMGAFGFGFFLGLLSLGRIPGITLLGTMGGFSIGVRIILFRPGLLDPDSLAVNWLIITVIGIIGFVIVVMRQRVAITLGSAAVGTFLVALGIDLVINKQEGMGRGLRYLFDRNNVHLVEIDTIGWHPPMVTEIIMGVSLALTPLLAIMQHYIFRQPFKRVRSDSLASLVTEHGTPRNSSNTVLPKVFVNDESIETETLKPENTSEKAFKDTSPANSPVTSPISSPTSPGFVGLAV
ncbi:hypothetical protein EUX98_g8253 [Antrodiella citrinella]|uniref:TM7S3/TM198-like domain-containing protein n=1 Tax=Antrodiella citrinella TaxID=2447956 RepID=A0A4S4MBB7_9APHY|nr:hypothetical protein EUX98_g8253 [Antrodiella citrinella]